MIDTTVAQVSTGAGTAGLSAAERDKKERHAKHLQTAINTHKKERRRRYRDLVNRKRELEQAVSTYQTMDKGLESVQVPAAFIRLLYRRPSTLWDNGPLPWGATIDRDAELRSRPPITRLVHRDANAISLLMTLLYVAQIDFPAGSTFLNQRPNYIPRGTTEPWAQLAGFPTTGSTRAQRARFTTALRALESVGIVEPNKGRWAGFMLRVGDGRGDHVVLGDATARTVAVKVPAQFFYQGWHLVLKPKEIAVYLAILELSARFSWRPTVTPDQEGVALPIVERRGLYGITDEVYESIHLLDEFNLIDIKDTVDGRSRGKVKVFPPGDPNGSRAPEPYRLIYPPADVPSTGYLTGSTAFNFVEQHLRLYPAPPRLSDEINLEGFTLRWTPAPRP